MIPQSTAGRTLYSSFDNCGNVKRLKKHLQIITKLKSIDDQNGYTGEKCAVCDRETFQSADYWVVKGSETIQGAFGDNYHGLKEQEIKMICYFGEII